MFMNHLVSRSQECKKAKTSALMISQSFQVIGMKFGIYCQLRLVSVMNLILCLCRPFNIQGRKSYLYDFSTKKFNIGLYLDIWRPLSFKCGITIGTTELYIFISVWMTLTIIQGHSCMRNQKLLCRFSEKFRCWFGWNSVCCYNLLVCWSSCNIYFEQVICKGENSAEMIL